MVSFSRLSKTVDYREFAVTRDPGVTDQSCQNAFAQIDPTSHTMVGKYRIERLLDNSGGQSDVYLAKLHGQQFALKLFRKGLRQMLDVQNMLLQGDCPNIAPLIDFGLYKGEYWYEIYPFYSSGSLKDIIAERGKCSHHFIERVLIPSLDNAIHYLQERNLIHADIKPQNIFISDDLSNAILGDFGVAGVTSGEVGLVPFRGTLEYSPNTLHSGGQMRIDSSYDYGALGLVLIEAYTGYSLFANMSLDERDRALLSLKVPSNIPQKARILIEGLLQNDPRLRFGHEECKSFVDEKAIKGSFASRRGRGRLSSLERSARDSTFEFGFFDGRMVIANSMDSLSEACDAHWEGINAIIGAAKLKRFLRHQTGNDDFSDRFISPYERRSSTERAFWLCCGLRYYSKGKSDHTFIYKGKRFSGLVHLLETISSEEGHDYADILSGSTVAAYLRLYEYGDEVVHATEEILFKEIPLREKAQMLIAICSSSSLPLYVNGMLVQTVEDLLNRIPSMTNNDLEAMINEPAFVPWMHKNNCDDVIEDLENIHE